MALVRWEPMKEFEPFSQMMSRFFGEGARWPTESITLADWTPTVDIEETDKEFLVKAELAGIEKKDVEVTCQDGRLTIRGERKKEKEVKDKKVHRVERSYGSFVRMFTLPANTDATKVVAEMKDGVLLVHLPKVVKKEIEAFEVPVH